MLRVKTSWLFSPVRQKFYLPNISLQEKPYFPQYCSFPNPACLPSGKKQGLNYLPLLIYKNHIKCL